MACCVSAVQTSFCCFIVNGAGNAPLVCYTEKTARRAHKGGAPCSQEKKKPYLLSSVNNALKILDLLSVRDNIGVAEISRLLKLDKASVFKMLYTLEHRDYVIKTADAKYRLGIKFTNYGNLCGRTADGGRCGPRPIWRGFRPPRAKPCASAR